jgi:hypothetical protein
MAQPISTFAENKLILLIACIIRETTGHCIALDQWKCYQLNEIFRRFFPFVEFEIIQNNVRLRIYNTKTDNNMLVEESRLIVMWKYC